MSSKESVSESSGVMPTHHIRITVEYDKGLPKRITEEVVEAIDARGKLRLASYGERDNHFQWFHGFPENSDSSYPSKWNDYVLPLPDGMENMVLPPRQHKLDTSCIEPRLTLIRQSMIEQCAKRFQQRNTRERIERYVESVRNYCYSNEPNQNPFEKRVKRQF